MIAVQCDDERNKNVVLCGTNFLAKMQEVHENQNSFLGHSGRPIARATADGRMQAMNSRHEVLLP